MFVPSSWLVLNVKPVHTVFLLSLECIIMFNVCSVNHVVRFMSPSSFTFVYCKYNQKLKMHGEGLGMVQPAIPILVSSTNGRTCGPNMTINLAVGATYAFPF